MMRNKPSHKFTRPFPILVSHVEWRPGNEARMKPTSANGVLSGSAVLVAMSPPSSFPPLSGTCCPLTVSLRPGMIQISFLPEENSCSCLLLVSGGGFFCLRRFSNFLFRSATFLSVLSFASFSSSSCLLAYLIRGKKPSRYCSLVPTQLPRCSKIWSTWNGTNGVAMYNLLKYNLLKYNSASNKRESRRAISASLNNSMTSFPLTLSFYT